MLTILAALGGACPGSAQAASGPERENDNWQSKHPEWIWCDDFDSDRSASYFEYNNAGGAFTRVAGVGVNGSSAMKAVYAHGAVDVGALHLAFGKTPDPYFAPVDAGTAIYRSIYWRMYVKNQSGWTGGGGNKLSRAFVMATSGWAQAAFGHVWSGGSGDLDLMLDPASGTDAAGTLQTTTYNDFAHMRWLGQAPSSTPIFDSSHVGVWHCVEAHMQLNDAGNANGTFELWIDGVLEAQKTGLNWLGAYAAYGINMVYVENYWNAGSPQVQERYIDNLVVSTQPIGPIASPPPANHPPVASPGSATLAEGGSVAITLVASDADGDPLSYTVGTPAHGMLTGSGSSQTYTPTPGYQGSDSFTFTVSDGLADSNLATVSIRVTAAGSGGGGGGATGSGGGSSGGCGAGSAVGFLTGISLVLGLRRRQRR